MKLVVTGKNHLNTLLPLVGAYHRLEGLSLSDAHRKQALASTTGPETKPGKGTVDRTGRRTNRLGIGSQALEAVKAEAGVLNLKALHPEVARDNHRALYSRHGFTTRNHYHLMACKLA